MLIEQGEMPDGAKLELRQVSIHLLGTGMKTIFSLVTRYVSAWSRFRLPVGARDPIHSFVDFGYVSQLQRASDFRKDGAFRK
jgi:hypothetical protein